MGKHRDIISIILLILLGMFIPFLGSITLSYGFEAQKIAMTFLYFLFIFGLELGIVYLFFRMNSKNLNKKMEKYKPKP